MTITAATTDTMEIRLRVLGEVKVDDNIDRLDIDTSREEIRADEIAANTVAKVVEDTITMLLEHLSM